MAKQAEFDHTETVPITLAPNGREIFEAAGASESTLGVL